MRGKRRGWREAMLLLGALGLCPLAALIIGDDPAAPLRRAEALADAEASLGLLVEPALHGWAREHGWLLTAAGVVYLWAHVPVAGWALVWTWFLRRDAFPVVRDTFLWTQLVIVAVIVAVPTAPPRLLEDRGFTDTLAGLWGPRLADSAHLVQSPFAAMPSGHVAFALIAGGTFALLGDRRWLRCFGVLYPPLVFVVTLLTANHFWLDAVGAVVVVAIAVGLAWRLSLRHATAAPPRAPARGRPAPAPR